MEYGTIEREIQIDASPDVVFDVITSPEHIRGWWNGAETDVAPEAGTVAELAWGRGTDDAHVDTLTVVEADAPRRFSFRWVLEGAAEATATNSLLVVFELEARDGGTLLRLTESGFREKGWEGAVLEAAYADHVQGWDRFVPSIGAYVERLVATS